MKAENGNNKLAKFIATFIAIFFMFAGQLQVLAQDAGNTSTGSGGSATDSQAATAQAYQKCVDGLKDNPTNTQGCLDKQTAAQNCMNVSLTDAAKSICQSGTGTQEQINKCIDDYVQNPANSAGCEQKQIEASKCFTDFDSYVQELCQKQTGFSSTPTDQQPPTPATDGSGTTPPKITTPPPIPQISTLPGPQGTNVSQANIYLQQSFLPSIALTVIRIAIPLAVVFLIFGAVQLLTAYGSDEKISVAKKTLTWALVGLIISLLSYAIVQMIFYSGYEITTM